MRVSRCSRACARHRQGLRNQGRVGLEVAGLADEAARWGQRALAVEASCRGPRRGRNNIIISSEDTDRRRGAAKPMRTCAAQNGRRRALRWRVCSRTSRGADCLNERARSSGAAAWRWGNCLWVSKRPGLSVLRPQARSSALGSVSASAQCDGQGPTGNHAPRRRSTLVLGDSADRRARVQPGPPSPLPAGWR